MQICTIVPIAQTVGANRIVKAVAIPHPVGSPGLEPEAEHALRRAIVLRAVEALGTQIKDQTVFE